MPVEQTSRKYFDPRHSSWSALATEFFGSWRPYSFPSIFNQIVYNAVELQEEVLQVMEQGENDAGLTIEDLKLIFHGEGNDILSKVLLQRYWNTDV